MEGIPTLLDWCQRNGIKIDGRLKIGRSPHGGIGVFNGGETQIDAPASVVLIPKSAVLSVKSCSLSDWITPVPYGHGAHLALSLAVYVEM